jgi:quercetin dioxygenase-like cupin family protein
MLLVGFVFLSVSVSAQEGFVLKAGEGEALRNGIVVKVSPRDGSSGPILVEQTFPRGGSTGLHVHDQGDELFYVVSGRGSARLGATEQPIGPGDVIFVPASDAHRIQNLDNDDPLTVVFFMDSPELVELFRAIHERYTQDPNRAITSEEYAEFERRTGGGRSLD